MRVIILIVVLALVGYFLVSHFSGSPSEEERAVRSLERMFDKAVSDFLRAGRTAAGTGLDTVSGAHDAVLIIKKVERELKGLKERLEENAARERARKLEEKIRTFVEKNDLTLF